MFELAPEILALLAVTGFVAGTIDAMAGGGGLITIPVLLSVGIPPHIALGTNKFQSTFGTSVATWRYAGHGLIKFRQIWPMILGAFLGGCAGTLAVQQLHPEILKPIMPFLLIAMAVYFFFSKRLSDQDNHARIGVVAFAIACAFPTGFYDGFFGPGAGSFYTLGLLALLGYNAPRATANTKVMNLSSNIASLGMFLVAGQVLWQAAIVMAAAQILGGFTGAHLVMRHGTRLIRPVLVIVSIALSLKLLLYP